SDGCFSWHTTSKPKTVREKRWPRPSNTAGAGCRLSTHRRPGYSFRSCVPAAPRSASPGVEEHARYREAAQPRKHHRYEDKLQARLSTVPPVSGYHGFRKGAGRLRTARRSEHMMRTVPAVYENGAFRPLEPVSYQEQERVLLTVEDAASAEENLLDREFLAYCETQADDTVALEAVRQALAKIPGSLADEVRA